MATGTQVNSSNSWGQFERISSTLLPLGRDSSAANDLLVAAEMYNVGTLDSASAEFFPLNKRHEAHRKLG